MSNSGVNLCSHILRKSPCILGMRLVPKTEGLRKAQVAEESA